MPFSGQSTGRTRSCCLRRHLRANPSAAAAPEPTAGCPTSVTGVGDPVCRLPGSVASYGARSVARSRCRSDPVGRRTDLRRRRPPTRSSADADPVAGVGTSVCRLPGPVGPIDAVHADPVNRAIAVAPPEPAPHGQLGCPYGVGPAPRPVLTSVARRGVGSKLVASRPVPNPLRLVGSARLRPNPIRRSDSFSSVSQPRSACAARYEKTLSRTRNPWSRGIFQSPDLSPELFFNPQNLWTRPPSVHRPTGCFPHRFPPFVP